MNTGGDGSDVLDTKISMTAWLEKQVQGYSWYRLGSLFDLADESPEMK